MRSISHSTPNSSGRPSTAPSSSPFRASSRYSFSVILLKPKRASMTKVRYRPNGASSNAEMISTATMMAMPWASGDAEDTLRPVGAIFCMPPPRVKRQQQRGFEQRVQHAQVGLGAGVVGGFLVGGQVDLCRERPQALLLRCAAMWLTDGGVASHSLTSSGQQQCGKKQVENREWGHLHRGFEWSMDSFARTV